MKTIRLAGLLLCFALVSAAAFAQGVGGTLTGIVEDASRAIVPGVEIKATNTQTGIVTAALTNEAGAYLIPGLLPGVYKLTAQLPGFSTSTFDKIELNTNDTKRFNFTLQVAAVGTNVDVTIDATTLLSANSATIGEVLPANRVAELPMVGGDVLDLMQVMAGVRVSAVGGTFTTFAGISAEYVNTTVNGLSVQDGRGGIFGSLGVNTTTVINPDLVGEIRLILTPVDAELGRGNGQVQITTRSGTNRYTGAAVWNVRNNAMDARPWADNDAPPVPVRDWLNRHQYTLSYGGPIVRNKTFFYVLWDQLITRARSNVNSLVLTDCARNGIFRYFPDWGNSHAAQAPPSVPNTTTNVARAAVDPFGNPNPPAMYRNGADYADTLQYRSVYGPLPAGWTPSTPDCSDAPTPATFWDPLRTELDPTGWVTRALANMPRANNFSSAGGDGLNTAHFTWVRGRQGSDNGVGAVTNPGDQQNNRKQINIKVDQQFSQNHKLGVSWQYERNDAANAASNYPNGFWGLIYRRPQVWTANFTSTLSPSIVNEARFGLRRGVENSVDSFSNPSTGDRAREFFPNFNGLPFYIQIGSGAASFAGSSGLDFTSGYRALGDSTSGNITSLWNYADTLSWSRGTHAFKFGAEFRRDNSDGHTNNNLIPRGFNGASSAGGFAGDLPWNQAPFTGAALATNFSCNGPNAGPNGVNNPCIGLTGGFAGAFGGTGNLARMVNLNITMTNSMATITQLYYLQDGKQIDHFENFASVPDHFYSRTWLQNEFATFVKDDWKATKNLTLNLGLRYEYYGPPWEGHGLLPRPVGGGNAIWGRTGGWENLWSYATQKDASGNFIYPGTDLQLEFVGPGSLKPDLSPFKKDRNNFGPAVGFAWQVPWFGEGKTTLRGGYQLTFQGGGRAGDIDFDLGIAPGSVYTTTINAGPTTFSRMADFNNPSSCPTAVSTGCFPVPLPIVNGGFLKPLQAFPATTRATVLNAFDPNYVAPYVQNFTLSLTRNVSRNVTVDVRYIGTRGVKLFESLDVNTANFLKNGLKEAFDAARYGQDTDPAAELLNQMFMGINLGGTGATVVNGTTFTGAQAIRANTTLNNNLAIGNYVAVAQSLATLNYNRTLPGNTGLPVIPTGDVGAVLRFNGFPENFIVANPQAPVQGTITCVICAELKTNSGSSNYHSLQTQVTLRPTHGISWQGTYTWSKSLGLAYGGSGYTDPTDRRGDYTYGGGHRAHDVRMNGTFQLPIGPNKLILGNSSGWLARLVEGWQTSAIIQFTSGGRDDIEAQSMMYARGVPDLNQDALAYFGEFPRTFGSVHWDNNQTAGNYFSDDAINDPAFVVVPDPQCDGVHTLLQTGCRNSLNALARRLPAGTTGVQGQITLADGSPGLIVLQNPRPGTRGNLGQNIMENPGLWFFDGSASKSFRLTETKSLQLRVDATNVFNHPTPNNPTLDINSDNPFGNITSKGSVGTGIFATLSASPNRTFQASLRLMF